MKGTLPVRHNVVTGIIDTRKLIILVLEKKQENSGGCDTCLGYSIEK